ncbi:MAG: ABC transporter, partial [Jaaginema sp. PMC 1080.18]|nr:ABC transporter [Jaaginema sp. PMC 1080.18]MEC4864724.1 ABC transporter [Jaaginema sp. PMC 1078.18]
KATDSDEDKSDSDESEEDAEASKATDSDEDKSETPKKEARIVVFGNSSFAVNGWFNQQLNRDVFLNSVKWLAKIDEANLSIQAREPENRRLTLTVGQAGLMGWLAILIVPALGLAIAGMLWWRRR